MSPRKVPLDIPDVTVSAPATDAIDEGDRAQRILPNVKFTARLAGAIHKPKSAFDLARDAIAAFPDHEFESPAAARAARSAIQTDREPVIAAALLDQEIALQQHTALMDSIVKAVKPLVDIAPKSKGKPASIATAVRWALAELDRTRQDELRKLEARIEALEKRTSGPVARAPQTRAETPDVVDPPRRARLCRFNEDQECETHFLARKLTATECTEANVKLGSAE